MAAYTRVPQRFIYGGMVAVPPDLLDPGKSPYVRNIRTYQDGTVQPRAGLAAVATGLGAGVHTLARLNDSTTFNGGVSAVRVYGAGTSVFRGIPSNLTPGSIDSGYSGDPLVTLSAQPPRSPRPYQYIADRLRYRKFTTNGNALQVGIAQPSDPTTEPTGAIDVQHISDHDILTSTSWSLAGNADNPIAGTLRIDTTISQILFDAGTTGYCSIVPADSTNMTVGTLVTVGNPAGVPLVDFENALITDITIAVAPTTVESIQYDSGTTGLCTIQPAGSLGTGQLDAPPLEAYRRRVAAQTASPVPTVPPGANIFRQIEVATAAAQAAQVAAANLPPEPTIVDVTRRIRQVDFPVNSIVILNGTETVRILSVAVGEDGVQSFRCRTATTIAAGATITGLAAIRLYLTLPIVVGQQIIRQQVTQNLLYPTPASGDKAYLTGGIQSAYAISLAQFSNGQAVLPEDEIHLAIKVDRLTEVVSVRLYLDVDQTTNDFLQNYFFHEWRASDIVTAIQGTNAANVTPLVDARQTVVTNIQLDKVTLFSRQATIRRLKAAQEAQSAISTQLALGNNQWIDLRVKIGTLTRVGTDTTRTLADVKAFEVLVAAEGPIPDVVPTDIAVAYSDIQIYGGGGVDVGEIGDPYVYTYRYRSSETGAVSNPAPHMRGGLIPRRQDVLLTATPSTDPQVDRIDWFRLGGTLTQYTYVGTGPNTSAVYTDDRMDQMIDGGEILRSDQFQPWALQDLPRTGTCNVAGTAVTWVSGDTFNTSWAPGSPILINGRATLLYASPQTSTQLQITDNVGTGSAVEFSLPGPTLLSQPLARVWGDYRGFWFACGDQTNPGSLYYSHGNNIEATADDRLVLATTPSEPLMNGGIYNTFAFVFSSQELYQILLQPSDPIPVRVNRTPCGRGLWTPWAFDIGPEGIYFLAQDGIFLTGGGSPAVPITSDLRVIFPHDGLPGESVNGIPVPDMTQTNNLRLSYIAGMLYFDFLDTDGAYQTLIFDVFRKLWSHDNSGLAGAEVRLEEPGAGVYDQIVGMSNGSVYQYDDSAIRDDSADIDWEFQTGWTDASAPRVIKQWGDVGIDLNANNSVNGITVQVIAEDGSISPTGVAYGAGDSTRQSYIVDFLSGGGLLARNLGLKVTGTLTSGDSGRPILYWWEPSYVPKVEDVARRTTDWEDLGYHGAKFVQGIIIRANTYGQDKLLRIEKDGGALGINLTINHNGEEQIAYPLVAAGWEPFVTELIRIVGADDNPWQLLSYKFVWEPAPELATEWKTQWTTHDLPGFMTVHDMVMAYEATAPLTLTLRVDDQTIIQTIPATGGGYKRFYFILCPNKGKAVQYQWNTDEPARIYKRDVSVRVQGWGIPGGYQVMSPFGGPHRSSGAEV